jgi:toxin ParE1/3/4
VITSFRPAAQAELISATTWYLDEAGGRIASDFQLAVQHALQVLALMPRLGTPAYGDARIWPVKPFAYTLVYRVVGDELVVMAVAHQRRAAGYWAGRN